MQGRAIKYSQQELNWIKKNATMPRRALHTAFVSKFNRPDVNQDAIKALCSRSGWKTGRTGFFEKGGDSWNKGQKMPFNAASAGTQFKRGHTPANHRPLWSERINKYGYVEMKVPEPDPHTKAPTRWVAKHKYLWEKTNGAVKKGMALKSLDGNPKNTDPSNWHEIPYAMQPRLNGKSGREYDAAPQELKPIIWATAELEHAAREKAK